MSEPVYRPPSVWITQVFLLFSLVFSAIALPISVLQCFSSQPTLSCSSPPRIASFVITALTLILILLTYWGLQKRTLYGKWLGVIFLVIVMVVGIVKSPYFQIVSNSVTQGNPLPSPPYDCWQGSAANVEQSDCGYSSYLDLALRGTLAVLFPNILLGFLAIRLMSSRAARRFFNRVDSHVE
jgi:hypothetical protein